MQSLIVYSVLEDLPVGIVCVNPQTRQILFVNTAWCHITGFNKVEVIGQNIETLHPKEISEAVIDSFTNYHKPEIKVTRNIPVYHKDQSISYFDITSRFRELDGVTIRIGSFVESSERMNLEAKANELTSRLSDLAHLLPDLIFTINDSGTITEVFCKPDQFCNYFQQLESGKSFFEMIPDKTRKEFIDSEEATLEFGCPEENPDCWFEIRKVKGSSGKDRVVIIREISEQIRVRKETESLKEDLLNAQRIARMANWNYQYNEKKVYFSDTGKEILGCSTNSLHLKEMLSYIPAEDRKQIIEAYSESLKTNTYSVEHRIVVNGGISWIKVKGTIERKNGYPVFNGVFYDITELKEAQLVAWENMELLKAVIANIPDPVWLKDTRGVYILCNQAFELLYGARADEIAGRTDYDFVPKELADFFLENDRKAIEADAPRINEEELTFKGKDYKGIFQTIKTPMKNFRGKVFGVLGIARDISELKQVNSALLLSELRLRDAQRSARIGNWDMDIPGDLIYWSDEMFEIFEQDKHRFEPTFNNFFELLHTDDKEKVSNAFQDSIQNGVPFQLIHRITVGSGEDKFIHCRALIEYNDSGKPVRAIGTSQDITDFIQVEMALKERENLLESIFNSVTNGLFLIGKNKNGELSLLSANSPFFRLTGLSDSDSLEEADRKLKNTPEFSSFYRQIQDAVKENREFISEGSRQVNNTEIYFEISLIPTYRNTSQFMYLVGSVYDITRRTEFENEITRQNEIFRKITWIQSHEIRRPLANILALLNLIESETDEEIKSLLHSNMKSEAFDLDKRISEIVNLSYEANKGTPKTTL